MRRRHTLCMRTRRLASPWPSPLSIGRPMARLNTVASDTGDRRRKVKREPMSAGLFWRGVPVRHHLRVDDSATHACGAIGI